MMQKSQSNIRRKRNYAEFQESEREVRKAAKEPLSHRTVRSMNRLKL